MNWLLLEFGQHINIHQLEIIGSRSGLYWVWSPKDDSCMRQALHSKGSSARRMVKGSGPQILCWSDGRYSWFHVSKSLVLCTDVRWVCLHDDMNEYDSMTLLWYSWTRLASQNLSTDWFNGSLKVRNQGFLENRSKSVLSWFWKSYTEPKFKMPSWFLQIFKTSFQQYCLMVQKSG